MRNLAPDILRQRLLLEGYYQIDVTKKTIEKYFQTITTNLSLKTYGDPIIHSTGGIGKDENQGFDAFVPLIDSGISIYVWTKQQFFSGILYSCKKFDDKKAAEATKTFFKMEDIEKFSF